MPCYHPLRGYRSRSVNPATGKRSIVFNRNEGWLDQEVNLPCGQCIGCRLERSRQWAIRCVHEASLSPFNSFITLTYNNDNLPENGSLKLRDFQLFMKRLRKKVGRPIRYFHCGEYGENLGRPHYHACLFNLDFADKELHSVRNGHKVFTSRFLSETWGCGFALSGDVTFESAAYVARYVTKKVTGEHAEHWYNEIDYETGEIVKERTPEYVTMSRRPGIAKAWFDKYYSSVYAKDGVILNGKKIRPPKYYDGQYEIIAPVELSRVKAKRIKNAEIFADNNTIDRRHVREQIQFERFSRLKRGFENS